MLVTDLVSQLVALVDAYQAVHAVEHGDHGASGDCASCRRLHLLHRRVHLAMWEVVDDVLAPDPARLEVVA